jgi:hypothetical protein
MAMTLIALPHMKASAARPLPTIGFAGYAAAIGVIGCAV